jgi:hypothetical protein
MGCIAILLVISLVCIPAGASAQCDYMVLESGVPATIYSTDTWYPCVFNQTESRWAAVGVRPPGTDNVDLSLNESTGPAPVCAQGQLITSEAGAALVNFVVGDFRNAPTGSYYPILTDVLGPTIDATIEWEESAKTLTVNDSLRTGVWDPDNVIDIWEVYLVAGVEYAFHFYHTEEVALRICVLESPDSPPYWASRHTALINTTAIPSPIPFTPNRTGYHAVVLINPWPATTRYEIGVGTCEPPQGLVSDVAVPANQHQNHFSFTPTAQRWNAVGFRYPGSVDRDLHIRDEPTGFEYPYCFGGDLWCREGIDPVLVLAGYYGSPRDLPGDLYVRAESPPGTGYPMVEWEAGIPMLEVNGPPVTMSMGPDDVVQVWDVILETGVTYTINFSDIGDANLRYNVYSPEASAWYPVLEFSRTWSHTFTATKNADHGIVVINENGGYGEYTMSITTCDKPVPLQNEAPVPTTMNQTGETYSFLQDEPQWAVIGLRCTEEWSLTGFRHASGGSQGLECVSGQLVHSYFPNSPIGTDIIVGDFNRNPLGDHYAQGWQLSGPYTQGRIEWDEGHGFLPTDGSYVSRDFGILNMVDIYDVMLMEGETYDLAFTRTGDADLKLLIFQADGETYWGERADALLVATASTSFTAPSTGIYGFVLVNDNEGTGGATLAVTPTTLPATAVLPRTGIRSLVPNPTRSSLTIDFSLAEPGPTHFEIVDVAGRVIATLDVESRVMGDWTTSWDGIASGGQRAAPGVYFVKMKHAGKPVDGRRFVLLR